jgi:hypothetical protein
LPRRSINRQPFIQPILIQFLTVKTDRRFYPDTPFNWLTALGTGDNSHYFFSQSVSYFSMFFSLNSFCCSPEQSDFPADYYFGRVKSQGSFRVPLSLAMKRRKSNLLRAGSKCLFYGTLFTDLSP